MDYSYSFTVNNVIANCHSYNEPHYHLEHFKSCLSKGAVGPFTEITPSNQVCWILRNYDHSLHHLYKVEQYRRRGLASAVVRMMCRHTQDQGDVHAILCVTQYDNHTSVRLFNSLGFTASNHKSSFFSLKTAWTIVLIIINIIIVQINNICFYNSHTISFIITFVRTHKIKAPFARMLWEL